MSNLSDKAKFVGFVAICVIFLSIVIVAIATALKDVHP